LLLETNKKDAISRVDWVWVPECLEKVGESAESGEKEGRGEGEGELGKGGREGDVGGGFGGARSGGVIGISVGASASTGKAGSIWL
jgi:hypothetical protein